MIKSFELYSFYFVVHRKSRYKASKTTKDELRLRVFESLNQREQELRLSLEQNVKTAFYRSGQALIKLNQLRLYRSTHLSFEEFCQDVFAAACEAGKRRAFATWAHTPCVVTMPISKWQQNRVYQNLIDNLPPTNGRQVILPTRQRQLRPIVKAKLNDEAQVEVWNMAIALAEGKVPSSSIVIDVQPTRSQICLTAVGAADWVLIPAESATKGVNSLLDTQKFLAEQASVMAFRGQILGIIPFRDRWVGRTQTLESKDNIAAMREFADRALVLPTIRESEKFKQATRQGLLLSQLAAKDLEYPFEKIIELLENCERLTSNASTDEPVNTVTV